jgi:hypothetical protein
MGFFLVLKAELVRGWIIMRRYWFATLTGIVMGYGMLMMLIIAFMGSTEKMQEFADTTVGNVLGFIIGLFAFGIVGMFSQGLSNMSRTGELEQLYMSPHGLITNFLARSFVGSLMTIFSSTVLLTMIAYTVKGRLHPDPLPTIVLLSLTYINLIGFGFMVGGLVLIFKQTGQLAIMVRLLLMAVAIGASEAIETWRGGMLNVVRWMAHLLPITDAAICLKYVLIRNQKVPVLDATGEAMLDASGDVLLQHLSVFQHSSFYFLLLNCVIWTVIGLVCFRIMEDWARDKGTLGAY